MIDEVVEKHRKEKKELREKIIGLKRSCNKKDKKKLQDEIGKYKNIIIEKKNNKNNSNFN